MIVLGPHVVARPEPEEKNYDISPEHDGITEQLLDTLNAVETDVCAETLASDALSTRWEETRIEISRLLGFIGAAPLSPPLSNHLNTMSKPGTDDAGSCSYFDTTTALAASHIELIQTLDFSLEVIRKGASLRLGLGPIHPGNERVIARAEKAWAERELRQNLGLDSNHFPRLTLSKSRQILRQIMIDLGTSLKVILSHLVNNIESAQWDEFIEDMQYYSHQNAHVLTLSTLSLWLNGLRDLLSFVMSELLSVCSGTQGRQFVTLLEQSVQLANERTQYLQSAFNLLLSNDGFPSVMTSTAQLSDDSTSRGAISTIQQVQSTLEAAQVSLWALNQSFLEGQDQSTGSPAENPRVWLSQFKELLSQTESSMHLFENAFLPASIDEDLQNIEEESATAISTINNVQSTELINEEPPEEQEVQDTVINRHSVSANEHADKTWIFSASGQQSSIRRKRSEHEPRAASRSSEMFEQALLMRDLEKRLCTIRLAKEHEAVRLDANKDDGGDLNAKEMRSVPLFLGVQGSLLSELSSALNGGKDEDFCNEGDVKFK
ncbi:hypothetical protein ACHAXN_004651 [Cyclotella atomus]